MMSVFGYIIFGYTQNGNLVMVHALDWGSRTQPAATASPKQQRKKFGNVFGRNIARWQHSNLKKNREWHLAEKMLIRNVKFNLHYFLLFTHQEDQVQNWLIFVRKLKNRRLVCLCWLGYYTQSTHWRYPIATQHGPFELLCFQPHPVRVSLNNLDTTCSHVAPISMPSSMRTPIQREIMGSSDPNLKPSSISGLPVAWITEPATDPSQKKVTNLK